jgi:hypothetical protein
MPAPSISAAPVGLRVALVPADAAAGVATRRASVAQDGGPTSPPPLPTRHETSANARPVDPQATQRLAELRQGERREELDRMRQTVGALPPDKIPHASYLLARHVDGRPLEGEDLERLGRGDDTVLQARHGLRRGRGNVDEDIARTDHESSRRVRVAREIVLEAGETNETMAVAAAALFLQAGNCLEHADAALALHAIRQAPDETAVVVKPANVDHNFLELRTGLGREHDVVVDPWADGPAIMASDGRFSAPQEPDELARLPAELAPRATAELDTRLDELRVFQPQRVESRLDELAQAGFRYGGEIYPSMDVMSDEFLQRVAHGLDKTVKPGQAREATALDAMSGAMQTLLGRHPKRDAMGPVRNEILAAGIARDLGSRVECAAEEATEIVAELRRHTDA